MQCTRHMVFNYLILCNAEVIKKDLSSGVPLWISEDLEAWPERDQPIRFTQIASLHSEFIGVTAKGELHQWKWSEHEPYRSAEVRIQIAALALLFTPHFVLLLLRFPFPESQHLPPENVDTEPGL